nr:MAG TPA: hypothetical protein [Caudoviricetes sp.]
MLLPNRRLKIMLNMNSWLVVLKRCSRIAAVLF